MTLRKTFVLVWLALAVLAGTAGEASAVLPPPKITLILATIDGGCGASSPGAVELSQGVTWSNQSGATRRIEQKQGFWSFTVSDGGSHLTATNASGTYKVRCDDGAYFDTVEVSITKGKTTGNSFTLTWASSAAAGSWRYDVQYRIGSSGTFKTWKSATSLRSATFNGVNGKTYDFRARAIRNGQKVGWSPLRKATV